MTRLKLRTYLVGSVVCCALYFGCGGGSDSNDSGGLTDAENDIRVGRDITRCGVLEVDDARVEEIEQFLAGARLARAQTVPISSRALGSVSVPVFFHVIASGNSPAEGNVPDSQLQSQIAVLNGAYAGSANSAGTPFHFEIAGITRTIEPAFVDMLLGSSVEATVKQSLHQGDARTLNVYVAAPSDGTLGYAYFPWDYTAQPLLDGVVLSYETLPDGSLPPYNLGDTLVHEVGHWLGLLHTFQDSCSSQNDLIADTSAEAEPAFGCPVGRNTCRGEGVDPITNFMDYSDDECLVQFTQEQAARIDEVSLVFRGL